MRRLSASKARGPTHARLSGSDGQRVEEVAAFGKNARRAIDEATDLKDADTADLFTEGSRDIDKLLWMVEAHVQK